MAIKNLFPFRLAYTIRFNLEITEESLKPNIETHALRGNYGRQSSNALLLASLWVRPLQHQVDQWGQRPASTQQGGLQAAPVSHPCSQPAQGNAMAFH